MSTLNKRLDHAENRQDEMRAEHQAQQKADRTQWDAQQSALKAAYDGQIAALRAQIDALQTAARASANEPDNPDAGKPERKGSTKR